MKISISSLRSSRTRFLDLATTLETYHVLDTSLYGNINFHSKELQTRFLDLATTLEAYHFLNTYLYEINCFWSKELQDQIPGFGTPS